MANKTLEQLIARVKQLIGRTGVESANLDLTGIIIDALNDAQIRVVEKCPNLPELQVKNTISLITAEDEYEYDLSDVDPPIAHLKPRLWIIDTDTVYKVNFKELNKFDNANPDVEQNASGIPSCFTKRANILEFDCPIASDYDGLDIRIDYCRWATPFEEDDDEAVSDIENPDTGLILYAWAEALRIIAKGDAAILNAANEKRMMFEEWLGKFSNYHDMQAEELAEDEITTYSDEE